MASTTFTDGTTVIYSSWLNDVNNSVYNILGNPATVAAARTNLGLAIGTDIQAYDAGLQSISGLVTAADKMIYTTAADVYATADLTALGRSILAGATAAAVQTTLSLVPGTNVQTQNSHLQNISDLILTGQAGNKLIVNALETGLELIEPEEEVDREARYQNDFISLPETSVGTTASLNNTFSSVNRVGITQQSGYNLGPQSASHWIGNQCIIGPGGPVTLGCDFLMDTIGSATTDYILRVGMGDVFNPPGAFTNGIYLEYRYSVNGGRFQAVTTAASTSTTTDTGVSLVASTWNALKIKTDATWSNVYFYLNDVLVATHTTNIPTGTALFPLGTSLEVSTAAGPFYIYTDYFHFRKVLSTSR